jgi:D-glycero-D-manno-heptose 1,7-bisphosphate phosphatase
MRKAVFLDRDGVINHSIVSEGSPRPPKEIEDVFILDGVIQAVNMLKLHDFLPIVVTNQPDVSRGIITRQKVEQIHEYIGSVAGIDHFYACYHDDSDLCGCRKPAPGLILRATEELGLDISESFMVGDRWRDIGAGQAAGCRTFFIDYSYPEKQPRKPFIKVSSLIEAAEMIIGGHHGT